MGVIFKLTIAYQYWTLWYSPEIVDAPRIHNFLVLMVFEFIMVHSGVFMSAFPKKISLLIFVPFYGVFALIFTAIIDDYTILYIYMFVVLNRMRFAFANVPAWMRDRAIFTSVMALFAYILLIFVSLFGILPELGLNQEYVDASGFRSFTNSTGEFIDYPYKAISFGVLYYIVLAVIESYMIYNYKGIDDELEPEAKPKLKIRRRYRR